jgi:hypothetical protein
MIPVRVYHDRAGRGEPGAPAMGRAIVGAALLALEKK